MSSDPRNIPAEVVQVAHVIAKHTGLTESAILRQALCSAMLVAEGARRASRQSGLHADCLAKALRRHLLSSASEGGKQNEQ